MTERRTLRALVAGLLALILGVTALLAPPAVAAGPAAEPAAQAPWHLASVALKRSAGALSDLEDDTLAPTDKAPFVQRRVGVQSPAAMPALQRPARRRTYPARGPPGAAS